MISNVVNRPLQPSAPTLKKPSTVKFGMPWHREKVTESEAKAAIARSSFPLPNSEYPEGTLDDTVSKFMDLRTNELTSGRPEESGSIIETRSYNGAEPEINLITVYGKDLTDLQKLSEASGYNVAEAALINKLNSDQFL